MLHRYVIKSLTEDFFVMELYWWSKLINGVDFVLKCIKFWTRIGGGGADKY